MKKTTPALTVLLISFVLLCLEGCAGPSEKTAYVKEGKEYGKVHGTFRQRWWNYYERGLSFLEGKFLQEAISDFESAARQREQDQRMARTYGMHFIDYFPHRELGIAFFEIGNLDQAKGELELSLDQYPTAKTRFYLDRVRQALILQEGRLLEPPNIRLDVREPEIWTRDDPVVLSGIVEDENYVAGLIIQGTPFFMEGSQKQIQFKEKLSLSQGRHLILVIAENLGGKTAQRTLVIHVDREGPLITLEEVSRDKTQPDKGVTVKGSLYDGAGIAFFSINGVARPIEKKQEVFFDERIIPQTNLMVIIARDALGNETVANITLGPDILMGTGPLLLASSNEVIFNQPVAGIFGSRDENPPQIQIKGWTDKQTVYLEKIYVEGQVTDESNIVELTVNDVPVLRRTGRLIFFGHFAELKEGDNLLTIKARDKAGNTAMEGVTIRREIPVALKLDQRLSLSVMPFDQKGQISTASLSFQDNLIHSLVQRNRFQLVERQLLETILQEQKLSQTELIDQNTALKLGRLSAAHSIITGSIIESRNGIEIIARFIDTETSEILDTEDVYTEVSDLRALKNLSEGLALKFHRKFPLVSGSVIEKKDNYIFTDMGADIIGIQKRLIVYREEPVVHPLTGKVLGADNEILSRARVRQVSTAMSKAELVDQKGHQVERLDKVITE